MNSFSIPGPHLHGHHGRQWAKATGLPRQSLSSHLSPLARWRWGNKNRKNKERRRGKKTRTLHTNQKNGHLAEFMHERVRTVRRLVQGIVCQSSHSGQQAGGGGGAEWRTGTACQQGQATASAAYGRQVAYGGFSTQNQTETEPNQTEAMRNGTKWNQNEHVFQLKTLRRAPKIHLNCPQWTDTLAHALTHTHTHAYWETGRVQRQVINGTSSGILDAQKSQLCEFNEFRSLNALFNCLRYGKRMENI